MAKSFFALCRVCVYVPVDMAIAVWCVCRWCDSTVTVPDDGLGLTFTEAASAVSASSMELSLCTIGAQSKGLQPVVSPAEAQ